MAELPWHTIQDAFQQLGQRVTTTLRTQIGDESRLRAQQDECYRFLDVVQLVRCISHFPSPVFLMQRIAYTSDTASRLAGHRHKRAEYDPPSRANCCSSS
jgi:hypothetical protein